MTSPEFNAWNRTSQLHALTEINTQDFLAAFGVNYERLRYGRKLLAALCWIPARRFALQMVAYDQNVARLGLHRASADILGRYVQRFEIFGQENIPASGPLLVLSNHPGMTDTLILFASLPRPDLRVVAAVRPFLQALPNVSHYLISVPEEAAGRMGVVRAVVSHLRAGGAILTFPAGEIEPDPLSMPGAIEALANWSESIAIFARLVSEVKIMVAIVSGVIWPTVANSPLTRLRRHQKDRERLGAALQAFIQLSLPSYRPVITRVVFGPAYYPADLAGSMESSAITRAIAAQAKHLIEQSQLVHPRR